MPAARITAPHFTISLLKKAVKASGMLPMPCTPSARKRSYTSDLRTAIPVSRAMRSVISRGVPARTKMPCQDSTSICG